MHPAVASFACLLSMLPGPPGIEFENSYLQMLPVDKSKCPYVRPSRDIIFRLYTEHNPSVYEELTVGDDAALAATRIDFARHTVVYFHAFLESPDSESGTLIREGYTYRGHTNIIMVDARRLEAGPWYFTAAENTWYIGQYAARLLDYLASRGLRLSDTHLIGHSLGAQAAGVAGGALAGAGGRLARITGLDPALPLFAHLPPEHRLDAADARFVDVVHTDAGIFGIHNPVGHADFYPNGGVSPQPGCELETLWPRHMILEKCPTTSKLLPMTGFFLFTLEETSNVIQNKGNLNILKDINIARKKMDKYFRYSKEDANSKRIKKNLSNFVKKPKKNPERNKESLVLSIPDQEISFQNPKAVILHLDHDEVTLQNAKDKIGTEPHNRQKRFNHHTNQIKDKAGTEPQKHQKRSRFNHQTNQNEDRTGTELYKRHKRSLFNRRTNQNEDKTGPEPYKRQKRSCYNCQIDHNENKTGIELHKRQKRSVINRQTQQNEEKTGTDPHKRQKRSLFNRQSNQNDDNNMLLNILQFLIRNRKSVIPVVSVMREITTLVRSANGELNHSSKERNNYIGAAPPVIPPITYSLSLGKDPPMRAFVKRLLGIGSPTEQLSIASVPGK